MSGKTLSAKSVESGILEPRKDTNLSCSTILRTLPAVNFSLSNGRSFSIDSCGFCLTLLGDGSASSTGSGSLYCISPWPFSALGGMGISVRQSAKCVGF